MINNSKNGDVTHWKPLSDPPIEDVRRDYKFSDLVDEDGNELPEPPKEET